MSAESDVLLLGRQAELERIFRRLDERQPALVVLVGDVGAGKTAVLRTAAAEADAKGWKVIGLEHNEPDLTVDPRTTQFGFVELVHDLLRGADTWQPFPAVEAHVARPPRQPWATDVPALARELAAHAPIVVIVDGFRPSQEFAEAFVRLARRIRDSHGAVLVLVGARRVGLSEPVVRAADEVVELGPLAAAPVRRYFEELSLEPPITPEEVEAYAEEAVRRPDNAVALARVLTLAGPRAGDPS